MVEGIKNLFGGHKTPAPATTHVESVGGVKKLEKETYAHWGTRYAGHVDGDNKALQPALDLVLLTERQRQTQD